MALWLLIVLVRVTYCTALWLLIVLAYSYLLYWSFRSALGSVWLPQSKADVASLESDTS